MHGEGTPVCGRPQFLFLPLCVQVLHRFEAVEAMPLAVPLSVRELALAALQLEAAAGRWQVRQVLMCSWVASPA